MVHLQLLQDLEIFVLGTGDGPLDLASLGHQMFIVIIYQYIEKEMDGQFIVVLISLNVMHLF
jgi:hypothetical protein